VNKEDAGEECQEVKKSCGEITRKMTCGFGGAVESEGIAIECFWLFENTLTKESGRCEVAVC
jgi:hypothetical protein